jgi:hypothetical protein
MKAEQPTESGAGRRSRRAAAPDAPEGRNQARQPRDGLAVVCDDPVPPASTNASVRSRSASSCRSRAIRLRSAALARTLASACTKLTSEAAKR